MIRTIDTDADLAEGLDHLSRREPRFSARSSNDRPPPLRRAPERPAGSLRIITEQMLSLKAADAIWRRIEAELAPLDPPAILRRRHATLMKLGLSGAKGRTFKALARAAHGRVPGRPLSAMSDDEIIAALMAVPGIGPWTADIYLLSCLGPQRYLAGGRSGAAGRRRTMLFGLDARPMRAPCSALPSPGGPGARSPRGCSGPITARSRASHRRVD